MSSGAIPLNKAVANGEISIVNGEVLNSWKEIATYVGRGVRTVQRWEQELSFPVRRPRGKQRSAVIAFRQEIDLWLRTPHNEGCVRRSHITPEVHARLLRNTETLRLRTALLLENSDRLKKQVDRALAIAAMRDRILTMRAVVRKDQEVAVEIVGNSSTLKIGALGASTGSLGSH